MVKRDESSQGNSSPLVQDMQLLFQPPCVLTQILGFHLSKTKILNPQFRYRINFSRTLPPCSRAITSRKLYSRCTGSCIASHTTWLSKSYYCSSKNEGGERNLFGFYTIIQYFTHKWQNAFDLVLDVSKGRVRLFKEEKRKGNIFARQKKPRIINMIVNETPPRETWPLRRLTQCDENV